MPRLSASHYSEFLVRFGRNLQRMRREAGLTQEQLAEMADLHPRMIQKLEGGETNLRLTTAARLLSALRCAWYDLVPVSESVPTPGKIRAERGGRKRR